MVYAVDCGKDLRLELPGTDNERWVGFRVPSVSGLRFLGIRPVPGGSKCCSAEAEVYQFTQDILVILGISLWTGRTRLCISS